MTEQPARVQTTDTPAPGKVSVPTELDMMGNPIGWIEVDAIAADQWDIRRWRWPPG